MQQQKDKAEICRPEEEEPRREFVVDRLGSPAN